MYLFYLGTFLAIINSTESYHSFFLCDYQKIEGGNNDERFEKNDFSEYRRGFNDV